MIGEHGVKLIAEDTYHLLRLAFAEKSVVDVDGNQLLADGLDEQGGDN